ncbi:hypothetical protein E1H12_11240 [Geitlerinema sp. P-1104]|uniref:hypothetical protein n=1 Tax=Geitlerinema sp. P-1104 TaxID=2546230 RepID=UPI0014775441|nr:hypothetical protein [Geitlerinema sp. P-1104]NMG59075.1 hypothetical protein [Geitlerinema sp. P-1104]
MLDFSHLAELSRLHCLGICAFLVPSNLLATLTTLGVVGMGKPPHIKRLSAAVAMILAVTMILHVWTWFAVGVVQAPTFILLSLASVCLGLNSLALAAPHPVVLGYRWLRRLWHRYSEASAVKSGGY